MRGVVGVLLCVGLSSCLGYRIDPCGDNQEVQIDETGDVVFTCTGITADGVRWKVTDTDNTELVFGTCSTSGCIVTANNCSISRPQFNTSVLNVTGKYRRVAGTVECAGLNGGQIRGSATCKVKVVYTSYNVGNCTTQVNTPDWTVRGSCDVDKIYTSDGDYKCQWQKKDQTTAPGRLVLYPFTDSGTGQEYNRMTCTFNRPMPTTDGTHDYVLTIDPRKKPDETHNGQSIDIRSPKGPPVLHNCPPGVVEGDNVSCRCQASASDPPALVTWSSYSGDAVGNTTTLPLHSVHTALGGHSSTCSQFWAGFNTTHKKETNYTINVMYPPPSPPVIRGITNYTAGDSVNLTCTVTGGNPPVTSVTFYCENHRDGDDVTSTAEDQTSVTSAAVVSSLTARDNGSVCRCSGVWSARQSLYATTSTVTITVYNEKRDDDDDSSMAFIVGGAVGATVVIIIALVIVVVIIRRRRGKPQNEEDKRNATDEEDEFVEHINSMYQSADDPDLEQARPSAVALRIQSAGNGNAAPQDPPARDWHSGPSAPSGRPAHGEADSDLYSSADQPVTHPDPDMAMGPYASVGELDDSAHQRADVGLYSSADGGVDNPSFVIEKNSAHQPQDDNAYAVVNKSKKTPDPQNTEYAVVKKPRANLQQPAQPAGSASGEDDPADNVYAQVNKKSKGSHPVSPRPPEGEVENDAQAQTPQTTGKPLPAAKPGPLVAAKPPVPVKPQQAGTATNHDSENPRQGRSLVTSDYENVDQMTDTAQDNYNTLAFHPGPSPELSGNPESDYSHIGAV